MAECRMVYVRTVDVGAVGSRMHRAGVIGAPGLCSEDDTAGRNSHL